MSAQRQLLFLSFFNSVQSSIGVPKNIVVGCIALHVTLDVVLAFRGHEVVSWSIPSEING